VLSAQAGTNPPYGITLPGRKDKPVEFYGRDATTFPATADELRNTVLATAPPSAPGPAWAYAAAETVPGVGFRHALSMCSSAPTPSRNDPADGVDQTDQEA
jgi:hypothetical protein